MIDILSIRLGWCDKPGDIVEPALRWGLKGWTTGLKDGIDYPFGKDHIGTYEMLLMMIE